MNSEILVPMNAFAEYLEADTDEKKINILKYQLKMKVAESKAVYGNTARAQIRATILNGLNHSLTEKKIKEVRSLTPDEDDKWHKIDQKVNIAILERFKEMSFPKVIIGKKLEKIHTEYTTMPFYGVNIKIVPTLIFRININGKKHIGACMVHSSQKSPFTVTQSKIVATLLYQFLSYCIAQEDEYVNPELCFCIDPYAGTTINSNSHFSVDMKNIKKICSELPKNWYIAVQAFAA